MFVKITNGAIDQYPYTVGDLRRENPNTSFPRVIPSEVLEAYGVFLVHEEPQPAYDSATQKVITGYVPELKGGVWTLTKTVASLSDDEISKRADKAASDVRKKRDALLSNSDWVTIKAVDKNAEDSLGIQVPIVWLNYRQALRDITEHASFPYLSDSDWPVAP